MSDRLVHRGPDGSGVWASDDGSVALAHRRLAIVDLSERGRQPMSYAAGRYWITFNGEIYNFRELTEELSACGHQFRSGSDTEVILAAVAQWGVTRALGRFVGMFAFALWDNYERVLHLARDRMGEKPLFLGQIGDHLYFASELQAFRAIPDFKPAISTAAVAAYLRDGYVPGACSMYDGVIKVAPGRLITVPATRGHSLRSLVSEPYWSCLDVAILGQQAQLHDEREAAERLEHLLLQSVKLQMHADVPTGAFLSGGIDSSLITSLMQAQSSSPVHTFTVAFEDPRFDESQHARAISNHLGTRHEEFQLSEEQIVGRIPSLIGALDEPTANGSFFPVYLISEMARKRVTVVLSGDAGDELFGGYNRYSLARRAWRYVSWLPKPLRRRLASSFNSADHRSMNRRLSALARATSLGTQVSASSALAKLARVAARDDFEGAYASLMTCWDDPADLIEAQPPARPWSSRVQGQLSQMFLADQLDYLPGDNLSKLDTASMAVSLETRVPLLDHRVVEMSWHLPESMKLADGVTKRALRSILYKYVPRELMERKKMGFTVPLEAWLTGPLRSWAEDMLRTTRFLEDLPFRPGAVERAWRNYLQRGNPAAYQAWALVVLAAWISNARSPV